MRRTLYGLRRSRGTIASELLLAPIRRVVGRGRPAAAPTRSSAGRRGSAGSARTPRPRRRPRCPPPPARVWSARAAQLLLVGPSPMAPATTGGPATNICALPRTITEKCEADHARRAQPRHRAQRGADHRHPREVLERQLEPGDERHVGEAHRLDRLHAAAAAGAVHQPHEREPQLVRHALGVDHLLPDGRVGGAAAHREVVALHHGAPPVDAPVAHDHVRGRELRQLAVVAVLALARQRAGLVERAGVEQPLDALAHGEPAALVLARHLLRRRPSASPAPRAGGAPRARDPSSCRAGGYCEFCDNGAMRVSAKADYAVRAAVELAAAPTTAREGRAHRAGAGHPAQVPGEHPRGPAPRRPRAEPARARRAATGSPGRPAESPWPT